MLQQKIRGQGFFSLFEFYYFGRRGNPLFHRRNYFWATVWRIFAWAHEEPQLFLPPAVGTVMSPWPRKLCCFPLGGSLKIQGRELECVLGKKYYPRSQDTLSIITWQPRGGHSSVRLLDFSRGFIPILIIQPHSQGRHSLHRAVTGCSLLFFMCGLNIDNSLCLKHQTCKYLIQIINPPPYMRRYSHIWEFFSFLSFL